jgi:arabinogalactan oligomer/maltooligosaccharide transport system substrate-binding protein
MTRRTDGVRSARTWVTGLVAVAVAIGGTLVAAPSARAAEGITVWADATHAPVIEELLPNGYQGLPVTVVTKDPASWRSDLASVPASEAPDVIWGDLAQTGDLAAEGTIVPVTLGKKRATRFRENVLRGSQYGADRYGLPVQISNLALITNTKLVPKQPTTFAGLSDIALNLVETKKKVTVPLALSQGDGSNPWTTFPLFSGLGGYLFGRDADGALNPKDLGLASPKLIQKSGRIDRWNASGLLDSTLTKAAARKAFRKGKSPFWLAGPEDLPALLKLDFVYRIGAVPPILKNRTPVPLLTVHGFMVTKFANRHGVGEQASSLVSKKMSRIKPQLALASASRWLPANTDAAKEINIGGGRIRAIGAAGAAGVPMPNIPQAGAVWAPYGAAWSVSTSGSSATAAKDAFRIAEAAAEAAIG